MKYVLLFISLLFTMSIYAQRPKKDSFVRHESAKVVLEIKFDTLGKVQSLDFLKSLSTGNVSEEMIEMAKNDFLSKGQQLLDKERTQRFYFIYKFVCN